jgi:raffinose/stachyose/melibiose transport system permease protein
MYPFARGIGKIIPALFLLVPLLLYLVFGFLPSLATAVFSFTNMTGLPGQKWHFIGWDNYHRFFFSSDQNERLLSIWRTLYFALVVTVLQNGIGLFVAMLINQRLKGDSFFRALFFLPVVLGVTVCGLIWRLMFNPMSGPVEKFIELFGFHSSFLGSYTAAFPLIIFVQIWMYMGYSMLIFLAGLQAIPKDLYEAGYIDGASAWRTFRNITFPLIAPSFTVNILLSLIGALGTFDTIYVLTNGRFHTNTLAVDVFNQAFAGTLNLGYASAMSMIQFMFIFIVVVISQYYLRRREVQM